MLNPKEPITDANFPAFWRYAHRKHYIAKKKAMIRKPITFLSQTLFFFCFLILIYGTLYDRSTGLLRALLDQAPRLAQYWEKLSGLLYAGAESEAARMMRNVLVLYGIPLAASLVLFLIAGLLYHPLSPKLPDSPQDQAHALWVTSQHIRSFQQKGTSRASIFCGLFLGLIVGGFVLFFCLYYGKQPEFAEILRENASWASWYYAAAGLVVFLIYLLLTLPLNLLLMPLHRCSVPEAFHENAAAYEKLLRGRARAEASQQSE